MVSAGKIGRNDPCPCGSGKKFKKCCQVAQNDYFFPVDPQWRLIRNAIDKLIPELVEFSETSFGVEALKEAWGEFMRGVDEEEDAPPDPFHFPVFFSWFFYQWTPDLHSETFLAPDEIKETTISEVYLRKRKKKLDPIVVRYIEACQKSSLSYHDVLSVNPGTGFRLRDIMTGNEIDVLEHSASEGVTAGSILFGSVVSIDQMALLDACANFPIPVTKKPQILQLRAFIRKQHPVTTSEDLREYDFEMFNLYHLIMENLRNPAPPVLLNTDDEPVELHELTFEIDSPSKTFDALKTLSLVQTEKKMREAARFDGNGEIMTADISWEKSGNPIHSTWENTVMGTIRIEGKKLLIQTNSANRSRMIREIVEERLPRTVRFASDHILSQKDLLSRAQKTRKKGDEPSSPGRPELDKEAQKAVREFVNRNTRQWPHQNLRILDGKTPLEAVQTEDGRDMVRSIVLEMEQKTLMNGLPVDPDVFIEIRKELGI